jgi:protein-disulfide isomerase/uncharacterized membrane protein
MSSANSTSSVPSSPRAISEKAIFSALVALGLLGVALSIYLTTHFFDLKLGSAGFKSLCDVSSTVNCDVVSSSKWAEIFPYFPLSSAALGWFSALTVLSILWLTGSQREGIRKFLFVTTGLSVLVSLIYLFIMLTSVKAICLFCLGIDAINLVAFLAVLTATKLHPAKTSYTPVRWSSLLAIAGLAFVVPGALFGLANSKPLRGFPIQDAVISILNGKQETPTTPPEVASLGNSSAPVTIVKFSDFQCPHCQRGAMILHSLLRRFPDTVRVVYRNYPLDSKCNPKMQGGGHAYACAAAKTAICAQIQGKFKAVYEGLFEHQTELNDEKIKQIALDSGMDEAALAACMESEQTQDLLSKDLLEGDRLQVQSTPTFFINGYKVEGAYPPDVWAAVIEKLLAKAGS